MNVTEETDFDSSSFKHSFYVNAIYFSVSTFTHICLGDLSATNQSERNLNVLYIIFSVFVYSYLFGNIASMVSEFINVQFLELNEKY
jgi:Ion channel